MANRISVITASYNCCENLKETEQHLGNQKLDDFEWVIVDGDSKDDTKKFLNTQKLSKIWVSEKDNGIYNALNKGICLATGNIIGFLHSDDFFDNVNTLERISEIFEDPSIDGVYGNLQYVDKNDITKIRRNWVSKSFNRNLLHKGWMPPHPTLFLRKEVYDKYGLYDENYKIAADYEFMVRIFKDQNLKIKHLNETVTKMRMGGASNKSFKNIITKSYEDYKIMKKYKLGGFRTLLLKNFSKLKQFF